MPNTLRGLRTTLHNGIASVGCNDPALDEATKNTTDPYDQSIRKHNFVAGSTVIAETPRLVRGDRGPDGTATDTALTGTWVLVPGTAFTNATVRPPNTGDLYVYGGAWITGTGTIQFGLSNAAGTEPTTHFAEYAGLSSYDGMLGFGGLHPDAWAAGDTDAYLWARATTGSLTIEGTTQVPRWGLGWPVPDKELHNHLDTNGRGFRFTEADGTLRGVAVQLSDGTGIGIGRVNEDGTYEIKDGSTAYRAGMHEIAGEVVQVHGLAHGDADNTYSVKAVADGRLYVAKDPAPAQAEQATDDSANPGTIAWQEIPGLTVTFTEAITNTELALVQIELWMENTSGFFDTDYEIGLGVDRCRSH